MTPAEVATVEASLVSARFLGCRTRVAPRLAAILARVEEALHAEWQRAQVALPGGAATQTFAEWAGVTSCGGYRAPVKITGADGAVTYRAQGHHSRGLAVDMSYQQQGYLVTRTRTSRGVVYGGEAAGAGFAGVRKAFADACDRACMALDGKPADLSARYQGETTGEVWDRFDRISRGVVGMLAPYYPAVDDLDAGADDVLPGVTIPAQVAADYHALRVPLVVGSPSLSPRVTRNPAKGLIAWRRHTLVAPGDAGLRIGLCDLGPREAGDAHHVDTASRIASGAV